MNENQWKQVTASVKPNTYIGPYKDCNRGPESMSHRNLNQHQQYNQQIPYNHQYLQNRR